MLLQLFPVLSVSPNQSLWHIITVSLWFAAILLFVMEEVFLLCHMTWKIVGLLHSQVVPRYMVHVLFVFVDCVDTCVVPLVYTISWISRQPVFSNSTWCLLHSSFCLPSPLTFDNSLGWYVLGVLHVSCPHIWLQNSQPQMRMLLVSTCASIIMLCACNVHNLLVLVVVPVYYWKGYPPMGGHKPPYKFHSIIFCFVIGSWDYILGWSTLVGYQLECYVLISTKWCSQVEIFNVTVYVTCPWRWNSILDDKLGRGYVYCRCVDISWVKNKISSHYKSCSMRLFFLWLIIHYNVAIRQIFYLIPRHLVFCY